MNFNQHFCTFLLFYENAYMYNYVTHIYNVYIYIFIIILLERLLGDDTLISCFIEPVHP